MKYTDTSEKGLEAHNTQHLCLVKFVPIGTNCNL
jgi:hypothetical protein